MYFTSTYFSSLKGERQQTVLSDTRDRRNTAREIKGETRDRRHRARALKATQATKRKASKRALAEQTRLDKGETPLLSARLRFRALFRRVVCDLCSGTITFN